MKTYKQAFLFILFIILTSYMPFNSDKEIEQADKIQELEAKIKEANLKMDHLVCEMDNLHRVNAELSDPIIALKRVNRRKLFNECEEEKHIIATNFKLDGRKGYNIVMHNDLYKALICYPLRS